MRIAAVLLVIVSVGRAETADEYFEVGVDYLKKGLFSKSRAAFAESLVRAPAQPVPLAFLAVASTAEGRPVVEAAILLRWSFERLPKGKTLRLELGALLPSRRTLELMQNDLRRALKRAEPGERHHLLTVLAFLEVQDGDAAHSPALDELIQARPADDYAKALLDLRPKKKPGKQPAAKPRTRIPVDRPEPTRRRSRGGSGRGSSPTTSPSPSGPSCAGACSSWDRS